MLRSPPSLLLLVSLLLLLSFGFQALCERSLGRFGELNFRLDLLGRVVRRGERDSGSSSLGNGEGEEDLSSEVGGFVGSTASDRVKFSR